MKTIKFDNLIDSRTGQHVEIECDMAPEYLESIKEAGKLVAKKLKALSKDKEIGVDTYTLNVVEQKRLNKFEKKHAKKCSACVSVSFTQTEISIAVDVFCKSCGRNKNISDYECW